MRRSILTFTLYSHTNSTHTTYIHTTRINKKIHKYIKRQTKHVNIEEVNYHTRTRTSNQTHVHVIFIVNIEHGSSHQIHIALGGSTLIVCNCLTLFFSVL